MYTLALFLMIGVMGLVVDVGWAYFRRQVAQTAADAAVLAAATGASKSSPGSFTCGSNSVACQDPTPCPTSIPTPLTNNLQAGCLYAQQAGFSEASGQTVLISANTTSPPPGVPGVTVPYWVTVSVSESQKQTFAAIFNRFLNIGAHATASVFPSPGNCIYALDNTGVDISVNGSVSVSTACGIYADSTSNSALSVVGSGSVTVTGASINLVGGYSANSNTQVSPTPNTGVNPAQDPFASMPTPTPGSCVSSGISLKSNDTETINYGTYCGAITLGGQSSLTLNPGLYIVQGGLTVGGGATLSGTGVTIYIQSGSISVAGGASINLSAPTSGTYEGVAIFQDRSDTSSMGLNGGASQTISGAVYAPAANLTFTGGSTTLSTNTMLVAYTLSFVGNTSINAAPATEYTGGAGGPVLIQ
jgi:Flp pilus assembly protein TadG